MQMFVNLTGLLSPSEIHN